MTCAHFLILVDTKFEANILWENTNIEQWAYNMINLFNHRKLHDRNLCIKVAKRKNSEMQTVGHLSDTHNYVHIAELTKTKLPCSISYH